MRPYRIERLDPRTHDCTSFACSVDALDRYLKVTAPNDMGRGVSRVRVLCEQNSTVVIGYYSLSAASIEPTDLPDKLRKKMPRYPTLPALLLGRLAIDAAYHGRGLGTILLVDALQRCLRVSDEIGAVAVIVDAKDEHAARFYAHHDFQRFLDAPLKLFLPIRTIQAMGE